MAYITNQWLKGTIERSRGHHPLEVSFEASQANGKWDAEHMVVVDLCMTQNNGDYQSIYLTQNDLAYSLPFLVSLANETTKREIAIRVIRSLEDTPLLQLLSELFVERAKSSK